MAYTQEELDAVGPIPDNVNGGFRELTTQEKIDFLDDQAARVAETPSLPEVKRKLALDKLLTTISAIDSGLDEPTARAIFYMRTLNAGELQAIENAFLTYLLETTPVQSA